MKKQEWIFDLDVAKKTQRLLDIAFEVDRFPIVILLLIAIPLGVALQLYLFPIRITAKYNLEIVASKILG